MRLLKPLLDFYINSSIHVAISVVSLLWITILEFDLAMDMNLFWFVFFAAITGYNFVKYFGIAKFHHRRLASWLQVIQVFSLLCFLLMCFFAFNLSVHIIIYIGVFAIVTFLYAIPFLPERLFMDQQKNLRSIGGLKVYVIGLVWAGVTVLLPIINSNFPLNADVWITTLQRFLFVILLILPFEIRDLNYDSLKLSTIPQKIGIRNTKILGLALGIVFLLMEFFKDNLIMKNSAISFVIIVLAMLLLMFSKKSQNKYYSSFWVEGIPMVWLVLHFVF